MRSVCRVCTTQRGDRRALGAGSELKSFDVDNEYGKSALTKVYDDIMYNGRPMANVDVPGLDEAPGGFPTYAKQVRRRLARVGCIPSLRGAVVVSEVGAPF